MDKREQKHLIAEANGLLNRLVERAMTMQKVDRAEFERTVDAIDRVNQRLKRRENCYWAGVMQSRRGD